MTSKKSTSQHKSTKARKAGKTGAAQFIRKWRRLDVAVTVIAVILIGFGLWNNFVAKPMAGDGICREPGVTETVKLNDDSFSQQSVQLNRCDRLVVVNDSDLTYELAFGTHDKHVEYPGLSMQRLQPSEYFELDAVESGTYVMHDHLRDNAKLHVDIKD